MLPSTLGHLSKKGQMELPYKNVLDLLHHFLQKSQCNKELANCVGFEVRTFLEQVGCNKLSAEHLLKKLTNLFSSFQNLKELSLDEGQRHKVVCYFDELRDKQIESFKMIKLELEKRFPFVFAGSAILPLNLPAHRKMVPTKVPFMTAEDFQSSTQPHHSPSGITFQSTKPLSTSLAAEHDEANGKYTRLLKECIRQ